MFNAFEVLNLKVTFDISRETIEQAYLKAMYSHHPDQQKDKSSVQIQQAARINEAYKILKNPLQRALHCLQLFNISMSLAPLKNSEILMESMEMREALEEATTADTLAALLTKTENQKESLFLDLKKAFETKDFEKAVYLTERFRYMEKFYLEAQQKIWDLEESLLTLDHKYASSAA